VVAVGADRGPGFLIALLGVLKAGGTYLPLNLGLPATRMEHSLTESRARLALTTRESAAALESMIRFSGSELPIITIEEIEGCEEYHTENLDVLPQ
jgi:non-ribosomal peptide synthetase component F